LHPVNKTVEKHFSAVFKSGKRDKNLTGICPFFPIFKKNKKTENYGSN